MIVCIDGNDGTGKSSLIKKLREIFPEVVFQDRGLPSAMTDGGTTDEADLYIILDATISTCQKRLVQASKSLEEKYHNEQDLTYYREKFMQVANQINAVIINAESPIDKVCSEVVNIIKEKCLELGNISPSTGNL